MPSLYKDYLLSIEHFVCEQKSGSSWNYADMYQMMQQYRFNIKIKNTSETGTPSYRDSYTGKGVYIAGIRMTLYVSGAKFADGKKDWTTIYLTSYKDFEEYIAPQDSKIFYVEYTWLPAVPIPVKSIPTYVKTQHRELLYRKGGPKVPIQLD